MMSKGQTLQDPFLNSLRKERVPVSIYLVNGIKLQGQIDAFDQFVILLKNSVNQLVYKHAISTIVPTKAFKANFSAMIASNMQIEEGSYLVFIHQRYKLIKVNTFS